MVRVQCVVTRMLKEIEAASIEDKKEALKAFDKAVFGHIGFAVANTVRSIWFC